MLDKMRQIWDDVLIACDLVMFALVQGEVQSNLRFVYSFLQV